MCDSISCPKINQNVDKSWKSIMFYDCCNIRSTINSQCWFTQSSQFEMQRDAVVILVELRKRRNQSGLFWLFTIQWFSIIVVRIEHDFNFMFNHEIWSADFQLNLWALKFLFRDDDCINLVTFFCLLAANKFLIRQAHSKLIRWYYWNEWMIDFYAYEMINTFVRMETQLVAGVVAVFPVRSFSQKKNKKNVSLSRNHELCVLMLSIHFHYSQWLATIVLVAAIEQIEFFSN